MVGGATVATVVRSTASMSVAIMAGRASSNRPEAERILIRRWLGQKGSDCSIGPSAPSGLFAGFDRHVGVDPEDRARR